VLVKPYLAPPRAGAAELARLEAGAGGGYGVNVFLMLLAWRCLAGQ